MQFTDTLQLVFMIPEIQPEIIYQNLLLRN